MPSPRTPDLLTPSGQPDPVAISAEVERRLNDWRHRDDAYIAQRRPITREAVEYEAHLQAEAFGKSPLEVRLLEVERALEFLSYRPLHMSVEPDRIRLKAERERIEAELRKATFVTPVGEVVAAQVELEGV